MAENDLGDRLSRLERALDVDQRSLSRNDRRDLKRERRELRRQNKAEREAANATVLGGGVAVTFAVALVAMAIMNHDLWWLVFVALGIGSGGARQLNIALQRQREQKKVELPAPPEVDRAEQLCDELLNELKSSPEAVRAFLGQPEKTVESIRAACKQLKARHDEIASLSDAHAMEEIAKEKTRLDVAKPNLDAGTWQRACDALAQRQQLLEKTRAAADRVNSERDILLNTLESLRMRLKLAKTSGQDNLDGVRTEVGRLGDELSAISDALESAQAAGLSPVAPIEAETPATAKKGERV